MNQKQVWITIYSAAFAVILISACTGISAGSTLVWIDVPLDGLGFPQVQKINIEGHAASLEGIDHIELWVNGEPWATIKDLAHQGSLWNFQAEWSPPSAGTYTIQAIAIDAGGNSSPPDIARVTFGEQAVLFSPSPPPVLSITPEITTAPPTPPDTPTPTPSATALPQGEIQFWADPPEIQAGSCTVLHWRAENVSKVIFGGVEQPLKGSYKDCLCQNQRYTLKVILLDGSEAKRMLDVNVKGSCAPPTTQPPKDNTPPPVPVLAVPNNGLSISCRASQNLVWFPVQDPSGIARYEVQVQRHSGDGQWKDIPGSVFNDVHDKQLQVNVECGWYYRWRVRAVDGAGNNSPWSAWWLFSILLG